MNPTVWLILFGVICSIAKLSAQAPDSVYRNVKGMLVMSEYNFVFDVPADRHMYRAGNHDYFYPNQNVSMSNLVNKGFDTLSGGVRIAFMPGRYALKKEAIKVSAYDTSDCYQYKTMYFLPVILSYQFSDNTFGPICHQDYLNVLVNDSLRMYFKLDKRDITVKNSQSNFKKKKAK